MEIFLIELVLTVLIGFLCTTFIKNKKKSNIYFLVIVGFILATISGLRSSTIGTDTMQFYNAFKIINNNQYGWFDYGKTRYELGYFWLNKFIGVFSNDPQVFILVVSYITMIGIVYFIYMNSRNVVYSMILYQTMYYYCNSMNLSRQFIAITIAINSFYFVKQNKTIKASILVIIGGLFHTSALLILPVVIILSKISITSKNIYKILWSTIISSFTIPLIINIVIKLFPRYEFYLTYTSNFNGGKFMPLIYFSMIFMGCYFSYITKYSHEKNINFYNASIYVLIGAILLVVSNLYFESASRIMNYFLIYFIILVPEIFKFFDKGSRAILYTIFFIFSNVYYMNLINLGVAGVYPFIFNWQ